jgi:gliding motility-associated-like protein
LLRVPTINDNDEEPDETFSLLVTLTSSNTINSSAIGIGTILDNDAVPKASDDICSVDEDSQLKYNCSSNDLPNGVTNVWAIVKQPQHGNVTMDKNGSFIYTPHANFNGTDSFIYKLCDDDGDCDEATVSILVNSINDFPIANDDVIELKLDVNFDGDVSLNDIPSADGGNLWSLVTPPHDATIIFSPDGSFTLKPTTEFKGTESFVYQLCDVDGSCDTATVTISTSDIVPNQILTPNSDGKNDTFIIKGIEYYPDNFVAIYNRWGNLVYQKSGYFNEWDGYANVSKIGSNPLPSGTYYFVVDYAKGRHKVGFVFLQRSN